MSLLTAEQVAELDREFGFAPEPAPTPQPSTLTAPSSLTPEQVAELDREFGFVEQPPAAVSATAQPAVPEAGRSWQRSRDSGVVPGAATAVAPAPSAAPQAVSAAPSPIAGPQMPDLFQTAESSTTRVAPAMVDQRAAMAAEQQTAQARERFMATHPVVQQPSATPSPGPAAAASTAAKIKVLDTQVVKRFEDEPTAAGKAMLALKQTKPEDREALLRTIQDPKERSDVEAQLQALKLTYSPTTAAATSTAAGIVEATTKPRQYSRAPKSGTADRAAWNASYREGKAWAEQNGVDLEQVVRAPITDAEGNVADQAQYYIRGADGKQQPLQVPSEARTYLDAEMDRREESSWKQGGLHKKLQKIAAELDPSQVQEARIRNALSELKDSNSPTWQALTEGNLGVAIDQMVNDAAMRNDPEAARRLLALRKRFENEVGVRQGESEGALKKLYMDTVRMVGPLAKSAAMAAVPGVGPVASFAYWGRQGAGQVYGDLVEAGVDHELARKIAPAAGALYAAVEMVQIGQLTNVGKNAVKGKVINTVLALAKEKGLDWLHEVGEEGLQQLVTDLAQQVGTQLDEKAQKTDWGKWALDEMGRVGETLAQSAGPMGVLSVLGFGAGSVREAARAPAAAQQAQGGQQPITQQPQAPQAAPQAAQQPQEQAPAAQAAQPAQAVPVAQGAAVDQQAVEDETAAAVSQEIDPEDVQQALAGEEEAQEEQKEPETPQDDKRWVFKIGDRNAKRITLASKAEAMRQRDPSLTEEQALSAAYESSKNDVTGVESIAHFNSWADEAYRNHTEDDHVHHFHLHGDEMAMSAGFTDPATGEYVTLIAKADLNDFAVFNDTEGLGHDYTNDLNERLQQYAKSVIESDPRLREAKTAAEKTQAFVDTLADFKRDANDIKVVLPTNGKEVPLGISFGVGFDPVTAEDRLEKGKTDVGRNSVTIDSGVTNRYDTVKDVPGQDYSVLYYESGLRSKKLEARYAEAKSKQAKDAVSGGGQGISGPGRGTAVGTPTPDAAGTADTDQKVDEGGTGAGDEADDAAGVTTPPTKPTPAPGGAAAKTTDYDGPERHVQGSTVVASYNPTSRQQLKFSEEFYGLSAKQQGAAIAKERKRVKGLLKEATGRNDTTSKFQLTELDKQLNWYSRHNAVLRRMRGEQRSSQADKAEQKYIEEAAVTSVAGRQLKVDVNELLERVSDSALAGQLRGRYSPNSIARARAAIRKGNKDGKPAEEIRRVATEMLSTGRNPVDAARALDPQYDRSVAGQLGEIDERDRERRTGMGDVPAAGEQRRGERRVLGIPSPSFERTADELQADEGQAGARGGMDSEERAITALARRIAKADGVPQEAVRLAAAQTPDSDEARAAEVVGRMFGHRVVWYDVDAQSDASIQGITGVYIGGPYSRYVFLNIQAHLSGYLGTVGHELFHSLATQNPEAFHQFAQFARDQLTREGLGDVRRRARREGPLVAEEELYADFSAEAFQEPEFWEALYDESPSLFHEVMRALRRIFERVLSLGEKTLGRRVFQDAQAVQKRLAEMMSEFREGAEAESRALGDEGGVRHQRRGPNRRRIPHPIETRPGESFEQWMERNNIQVRMAHRTNYSRGFEVVEPANEQHAFLRHWTGEGFVVAYDMRQRFPSANEAIESVRQGWESARTGEAVRFQRKPPGPTEEEKMALRPQPPRPKEAIDKAERLQKEARSLRGKLVHMPDDNLLERANLTDQVNQWDQERHETIVGAIYEYAKRIGLRGVPYNKVDVALKNAKTAKHLREALDMLDERWQEAVKTALRTRVLKTVSEERLRMKRAQGKGRHADSDAIQNRRLVEYLDNITTERKTTVEAVDRAVAFFVQNPEAEMPDNIREAITKLYEGNVYTMDNKALVNVLRDIRSIKESGKTVWEVRRQRERDELETTVQKMLTEIVPPAGKSALEGAVNDRPAPYRKVSEFLWGHIRPERQIEWLARNFGDSATKRALWDPMIAAENEEITNLGKALERFQEIHKGLDMGAALSKPFMDLVIQKVDQKTGEETDVRVPITQDQGMAIYAHSKNSGNRLHLIGTGITDEMIAAVTERLPEEARRMVDAMQDYYDNEQYRRMSYVFELEHNVPMPQEQSYFPIQNVATNRAENAVVADLLARHGARAAGVQKGMTVSRIGSDAAFKRLSYLDTVVRNLAQSEHYMAYAPAVRKVNQVLNNRVIKTAMEARDKVVAGQIKDWLNAAAYGRVQGSQQSLDQLADFLRLNYSTAVLGLNLVTMFKQVTSLPVGMARVKKEFVARAALDLLQKPRATMAYINERSPMMRTRVQSYERELAELAEKDRYKRILGLQNLPAQARDAALAGIGAIDKATAAVVWYGKFLESMDQVMDADLAAKRADEVVRKTQSMGGILHLPRLYRAGGIARAYTMFTNDMNQRLNLFFEMWNARKQTSGAQKAHDLFWLTFVPATMMYMASHGGRPPWKDPEGWAKQFLSEIWGGLLFFSNVLDAAAETLAGKVKTMRGGKPDRGAAQFLSDMSPPAFGGIEDVAKGFAGGKPMTVLEGVAKIGGVPGYVPVKRSIKAGKRAWETKDARYLVWGEHAMKPVLGVEDAMRKRLTKPGGWEDRLEFKRWYDGLPAEKQADFRQSTPQFGRSYGKLNLSTKKQQQQFSRNAARARRELTGPELQKKLAEIEKERKRFTEERAKP